VSQVTTQKGSDWDAMQNVLGRERNFACQERTVTLLVNTAGNKIPRYQYPMLPSLLLPWEKLLSCTSHNDSAVPLRMKIQAICQERFIIINQKRRDGQ